MKRLTTVIMILSIVNFTVASMASAINWNNKYYLLFSAVEIFAVSFGTLIEEKQAKN